MKKEDKEQIRRILDEKAEHGAFWYSWLWSVLRPVSIGLCVLLVVTGVLMGVVNQIRRAYFDAVDPRDATPVSFTVSSGSSLTRVANNLEKAGLINNASVFKYYADFLGYGQKIQAGDYVLTRQMDTTQIMEQLTTGDGNPIVRNITVIPGWTVEDLADNLFAQGVIKDQAAFLQLCRSGSLFADYYYISDILKLNTYMSRPYALEGYLAPDTYEVYTNATPEEIIKKLLSQTGKVFNDVYDERAREIGMTMDQVIILASIIEKEAKTADFAKVSAVFHNRMSTAEALRYHGRLSEANGTLGSDATIKYVTGSRKMALNSNDTQMASPYNTYTNQGLPAGPICNPSPNAIHAALYPDTAFLQQGYLYFCSKEPDSGELAFAVTYADHQRNVAIYSPLWQAFDEEHGYND